MKNKQNTLWMNKQGQVFKYIKEMDVQYIDNAERNIYKGVILESQESGVEDTIVQSNQLEFLYTPVLPALPENHEEKLTESIKNLAESFGLDFDIFITNENTQKLKESLKFITENYLSVIFNKDWKKDYKDLNYEVHPQTKEMLESFINYVWMNVSAHKKYVESQKKEHENENN